MQVRVGLGLGLSALVHNYYCAELCTYVCVADTGRNEHYSTVSGLIRLVISLECFIEITPDFLCPFMND